MEALMVSRLAETISRIGYEPAFLASYERHWDERRAKWREYNVATKEKLGKWPGSPRSWDSKDRYQAMKARADLITDNPDASCLHCGTTEELQVAHKIPRALGGTYDRANLLVLCQPCHLRYDHMAARPRARDHRNYIAVQ